MTSRLVPPLAAIFLSGCFSLHGYTPARTLPPGRTEVQVSHEAFGELDEEGRPDLSPWGPTRAAARFGLREGLELGVQAGPLYGGGADLKLRLLDAGFLVAAIDPTVEIQLTLLRAVTFNGRVPLLVDLHPFDWLTLTLHGGPGYWLLEVWSGPESEIVYDLATPLYIAGALLELRLPDGHGVRFGASVAEAPGLETRIASGGVAIVIPVEMKAPRF